MWTEQYTKKISHALTVLTDSAGFTEDARKIRSETYKTDNLIDNISNNITGMSSCMKQIGSSVEATSFMTPHSDTDCIYYDPLFEVRDKSYVPPSDFPYLLMLKDRMTKPGYTKLQLHKEGKSLKHDESMQDYFKLLPDSMGRVVLSNEFTEAYANLKIKWNYERHGPADTLYTNSNTSCDQVLAYICQFVPEVIELWFQRNRTNGWPSSETCELFKKMGCFVVPVGHPRSPEANLEWRISLSNQELFLMHNLTMVQYRCYILLKMVKTLFIKPKYGDIITSYYCKTALFYTIENNNQNIWRSENLSFCLLKCLEQLSKWVNRKNCPNYFIPEKNMFEGKLSNKSQRKLKKYFAKYILNGNSPVLQILTLYDSYKLGINSTRFIPAVVNRGRIKFNMQKVYSYSLDTKSECYIEYLKAVLDCIQFSTERCGISGFQAFPEKIVNSWFVQKLFPETVDISCSLTMPKLQDLASYIYSNIDIRKAFSIIEKGILSKLESLHLVKALRENDMKAFESFFMALSYGKQAGSVNDLQNEIKLASYLFVIGDYRLCLKILKKAFLSFSETPIICYCAHHLVKNKSHKYHVINTQKVLPFEKLTDDISVCLNFDTFELDLVPCALIYDSFRSFGTPVYSSWKEDVIDINERNRIDEYIATCWVRTDPFVYLYFLQYKSYEALCDGGNTSAALNKLEEIILSDWNGSVDTHLDTTLNVLGHLYASKGWCVLALECFRRSWKITPLHNAAKWHVMFFLFGRC